MTDSQASFDRLPRLPPRGAESHKGDFGRALLIGGSRGMAGAIALAGIACLRGGAGLVRLAVPHGCQNAVAGFEPSYMTVGLPDDAEGRIAGNARGQLERLMADATAVACGPGLGQSSDLLELVAWLYQEVTQPIVLDADALNALAIRPDVLARPGGPRILTPHPGEFARLLKIDTKAVQSQREKLAAEAAARWQAVVVLKGHGTVVTDGQRTAVNGTGNPGMATGGSGDVLSGLIVALVCQKLSAFDAARLGVHLHGLAGDLAAAELGQASLMASDLPRFLPAAFKSLS